MFVSSQTKRGGRESERGSCRDGRQLEGIRGISGVQASCEERVASRTARSSASRPRRHSNSQTTMSWLEHWQSQQMRLTELTWPLCLITLQLCVSAILEGVCLCTVSSKV